MDLNQPPLKRSRDPAALNNLISPTRMSKELLGNPCQPPRPLFSQCLMETLQPVTPPLFRSNEALLSTPPFQCETVPVTPRLGKHEICRVRVTILSFCAIRIYSSTHIARGSCTRSRPNTKKEQSINSRHAIR